MTYLLFFFIFAPLSAGIDENRRRSRWWHRPVSAADTALELCVVQKASPCGEADSAPAKCKWRLCYIPLQRNPTATNTTKKSPISILAGIFRKFLPKCGFEIREKYLLYNLLWSFEIYTFFPVCHSTLLSFPALTETFWVHFLQVMINLL